MVNNGMVTIWERGRLGALGGSAPTGQSYPPPWTVQKPKTPPLGRSSGGVESPTRKGLVGHVQQDGPVRNQTVHGHALHGWGRRRRARSDVPIKRGTHLGKPPPVAGVDL